MNTGINLIDNKGYYSTVRNTPNLSNETFGKWRKLIYENCGIYFQDNKKYLLESRLLKRVIYLGLDNYEEYFDYMNFYQNKVKEITYLYDAITINETFFFRNQPQLDALVTNILPELISDKIKTGKKKIRIWSAASSSGEEAYSIAISINEFVKPKYPQLEFEIVGTDISSSVLETAKKGKYKMYAVRNTPEYYLKKYFRQSANNVYELSSSVKDMVTYKILNLYDDISMRTMLGFDVIFCANVLIYFDQSSKIKVVSNLYNSLSRGGYLFIGYSETLHNISKAFKIMNFPKTIAYKKEA